MRRNPINLILRLLAAIGYSFGVLSLIPVWAVVTTAVVLTIILRLTWGPQTATGTNIPPTLINSDPTPKCPDCGTRSWSLIGGQQFMVEHLECENGHRHDWLEIGAQALHGASWLYGEIKKAPDGFWCGPKTHKEGQKKHMGTDVA